MPSLPIHKSLLQLETKQYFCETLVTRTFKISGQLYYWNANFGSVGNNLIAYSIIEDNIEGVIS